jgi:hypothetical protein
MASLQNSPMQNRLRHDIGGMSLNFDRFRPRYGHAG